MCSPWDISVDQILQVSPHTRGRLWARPGRYVRLYFLQCIVYIHVGDILMYVHVHVYVHCRISCMWTPLGLNFKKMSLFNEV